MTRSRVAIAAVLALAPLAAPRPAAQSGSAPREPQSYTSAVTAILVDVVVRDRKDRPVTDLTASDFEVAEDGVRQTVDSFTRVSRGGGIGVGVAWRSPGRAIATPPATTGPAATTDSDADEATTAIVFGHLSSESLRLAQRATLEYIPMTGESGVQVGVFATEPGVRVVQRYTTDRTLVRQAVARLQPSGTSAEDLKADRNDELIARRRELRGEMESASGRVAAASGADLARASVELGQRESDLRMIQTELNMIRAFDNLDRDYRGYDTALALLSVVRSLSYFPGRKTIVFFSEGLPVSPALAARLDYVIDAANRTNVTTYAVDANGLRAKSTLTKLRKEVDAFAEERLTQVASGSDRTEQPLAMAFERVEDTLNLDSRTGLARLAADTGGFLVEQSNDLSSAFRRIDEDNRFHYLLTYSPKNTDFDGKFRAIQVKVRRPGTQVFARKGYRAIRAPAPVDAGGFETHALALLDRTPFPNAFPVHAAGFSFPDPARPGLTPVIVHVGTDALRFAVDERRSTYAAHAAIVVRVRDGRGQEVQKLSQEYLLTGEAKDLDAAKRGDILFYREVDLPPGVYTMESIVFDPMAGHGSARVVTLNVPPAGPSRLGMSSLVLVSRVEEVSDAPPAGSAVGPLYVGRMLLYPNLGEPIRRSAASELPFYFTLYGDVQRAQVHVQLLRNGQPLAEAPVEMPTAPGSRVQHVGRLPIGDLATGTYELRIRASDGRQEISRAAFFTVRE
jgi:VWFA-related protein